MSSIPSKEFQTACRKMEHDFFVLCQGTTVRTFERYADVRTLVTSLHPAAEYRSWAQHFDGRLWREVHVAGQCVLAICTRLSATELSRLGAK
jgi:hypothetical protein